MQTRLQDTEQRYELMQRLNQNLADELGSTLDELDALKRTVVDSQPLVISLPDVQKPKQATPQKLDEDESIVVPSFLRVMQAEQTLADSFVYDSDSRIASNLQRIRLHNGGIKRLEESSDGAGDVENENSIPQESSIAANVSFQNQRRATGTINASNQRGTNSGTGMIRGKSTPVLTSVNMAGVANNSNAQAAAAGAAGVAANAGGTTQQQKGNSNHQAIQHPTMVGALPAKSRSQAKKAPKPLPPIKVNPNVFHFHPPRRLPPANLNPSLSLVAVGNSTQSQQQSHQVLITNPSAASSSMSGNFSRINQSQRIMAQELRNAQHRPIHRNTLQSKTKPTKAIHHEDALLN